MEQILFTGINVNQLLEKIGKLFDTRLGQINQAPSKENEQKFISRNEVALLLKISLPTLHEYTNYGFLQSYKIGKRVLYKHVEVLNCIDKLATYKFKKGGNHGS